MIKMNKNNSDSTDKLNKNTHWKWLQILHHLLQMLMWWTKKEKQTPMASAAMNASAPASVTFGPPSLTQLSRSQLLSLLRSESKALGRKIEYLVLHCSDTRPDQDFTVEKLKACHKARGFGSYIGYHLYVRRDGTLYYTRPLRIIGCHVKGYNHNSIGVCYEGGHAPKGSLHKYEDNRTEAQKEVLQDVFATLHELFPNAKIVGHNEFGVAKACPCLSKENMEAFRSEITG